MEPRREREGGMVELCEGYSNSRCAMVCSGVARCATAVIVVVVVLNGAGGGGEGGGGG